MQNNIPLFHVHFEFLVLPIANLVKLRCRINDLFGSPLPEGNHDVFGFIYFFKIKKMVNLKKIKTGTQTLLQLRENNTFRFSQRG